MLLVLYMWYMYIKLVLFVSILVYINQTLTNDTDKMWVNEHYGCTGKITACLNAAPNLTLYLNVWKDGNGIITR